MKKVLLIGDSIRQGYDGYVKRFLEETCAVYYPKDNCRFAQYVLRHLGDWKRELQLGEDLDLIHWNVGLWDTLELYEDGCLTPPDFYAYFIEKICRRIKVHFPNAKVIFATTTPVLEERFPNPRVSIRRNAVVREYNEIAKNIVLKHGFAVNDLYAVIENVPEAYYSDMVHLYTAQGTQVLTDAVAKTICQTLGITYTKFTLEDYQTVKEVLGL